MGQAMNEGVAVFRDEAGMQAAYKTILELKDRYKRLGVHDSGKIFNTNLLFAFELGFMLDTAETICVSALARKESRGAHYRTDMPDRDDENWMKHILVQNTGEDMPSVDFSPVTVTRWEPQIRSY